jgi:heme-degrading monooxygenase HmoA
MKTVITETTVKAGQEQVWNEVYRRRLEDARRQPGFVGMELLIPEGEPNRRLVVGTWRSKDDWSAWHQTESFKQSRDAMNAATSDDGTPSWYDVETETYEQGQA